MATRSNILAWKIPRIEESDGVAKSWTHLSTHTHKKKWSWLKLCWMLQISLNTHTHTHTHTHTLALYCYKHNSSSRVKFEALENKSYTKKCTGIFQFLGLFHSNLFWKAWITTTLTAGSIVVRWVPTTCPALLRQLAKKINHTEKGIHKPFFGNKIIHLLFWLFA